MQLTLFDDDRQTTKSIKKPDTYKGITSFHKYWGKKPIESIIYFIETFTQKGDIVLDPFLGSGFISTECLVRKRRFIGMDINPVSIEHTLFLLDLPTAEEYLKALTEISTRLKNKIYASYTTYDNKIASHYLWKSDQLYQVWVSSGSGRSKQEREPVLFDQMQVEKFADYQVRNIRDARFFTNSRINAKSAMTISDLISKRALYNIDLLLDEIRTFPLALQRALLLTLTSASGQMSSMVFAITGRGKRKNAVSTKVEVGSWVIGYWRPELHFEINVWNCFMNRANKLYKALINVQNQQNKIFPSIEKLLQAEQGVTIIEDNCLKAMSQIPDRSIQLICTDPPHSDRIPYLELSEMWNAILNKGVSFEEEIIVSNAKERQKDKAKYTNDMQHFLRECDRILKGEGLLLLYFNARDKQSWQFLKLLENNPGLRLLGALPLHYSANSVVQDNRKGGLKSDYSLVICRPQNETAINDKLQSIPGWIGQIPHAQ